MENYFASQRDNIFRNVEVLIYVFDVESRELEKDMHYYQSCLDAILKNSSEAKIFCLIHKMDLVQEDQREQVSIVGSKKSNMSSVVSQIFCSLLMAQGFQGMVIWVCVVCMCVCACLCLCK